MALAKTSKNCGICGGEKRSLRMPDGSQFQSVPILVCLHCDANNDPEAYQGRATGSSR